MTIEELTDSLPGKNPGLRESKPTFGSRSEYVSVKLKKKWISTTRCECLKTRYGAGNG